MNIESVWEYPRPPRLEAVTERIRVVDGGRTLADTTEALRVLETSHPPVYYVPAEAVDFSRLARSATGRSFCEFKGFADYWSLDGGQDVAWSYPRPTDAYRGLAGHLAFYASRVEECWVDDERVLAQAGDFYGGWITQNLRGPFKGAPGTRHW